MFVCQPNLSIYITHMLRSGNYMTPGNRYYCANKCNIYEFLLPLRDAFYLIGLIAIKTNIDNMSPSKFLLFTCDWD